MTMPTLKRQPTRGTGRGGPRPRRPMARRERPTGWPLGPPPTRPPRPPCVGCRLRRPPPGNVGGTATRRSACGGHGGRTPPLRQHPQSPRPIVVRPLPQRRCPRQPPPPLMLPPLPRRVGDSDKCGRGSGSGGSTGSDPPDTPLPPPSQLAAAGAPAEAPPVTGQGGRRRSPRPHLKEKSRGLGWCRSRPLSSPPLLPPQRRRPCAEWPARTPPTVPECQHPPGCCRRHRHRRRWQAQHGTTQCAPWWSLPPPRHPRWTAP